MFSQEELQDPLHATSIPFVRVYGDEDAQLADSLERYQERLAMEGLPRS